MHQESTNIQDMPQSTEEGELREISHRAPCFYFSLVFMGILCGATFSIFAAGKHLYAFNLT